MNAFLVITLWVEALVLVASALVQRHYYKRIKAAAERSKAAALEAQAARDRARAAFERIRP